MNNTQLRKVSIRGTIMSLLPGSSERIHNCITSKFGIKKAAVNKHLREMVNDKVAFIKSEGSKRSYHANLVEIFREQYSLSDGLEEDIVFRSDIIPVLESINEEALDTWRYAFTEMFNNAMDHSNGSTVSVVVWKKYLGYEMIISDDGEGIFGKIQRSFDLYDKRQSLLELSKGKLTTSPDRHSGEGIFFTSRTVDSFAIMSDNLVFTHLHDAEYDFMDDYPNQQEGTTVYMTLNSFTDKNLGDVFQEYAPADEFIFGKTVVPIHLAQYDNDALVSRSQAKRVLTRVENFKVVVLDFEGVNQIGQGFAHEIFRVFRNDHPEIDIFPQNESQEIKNMIKRVTES